MVRIHTRSQKAGLALLAGSFALAPIVYGSYIEWQRFCEQLFTRTETLQCVFFGPLSKYLTPYVVVMILFFIVGLVLIFLPTIQRRLS